MAIFVKNYYTWHNKSRDRIWNALDCRRKEQLLANNEGFRYQEVGLSVRKLKGIHGLRWHIEKNE
ncbi:hypothetical protein BKA67DRAFT_261450 [Truncatella angustata]|uniref:Uncharacterized protein n=1 Tax=Truncatella angustata TaxID=152316 RepID=A0A9P8UKM1_9PEZI|nr:uncharacterized protein BKA67DRAFT_261450 [Truncatella angustata]KAH6653821.1 hypothetical protein BKA67DRAFT_261450 [Truncatella angustata]